MSNHIPLPDDEDDLTPEFTALMNKAEAVGVQLADTFKEAEDDEALMMALVVTVSKCVFAVVSRNNDCSTVPGIKKFLMAQELFLAYFTMSHQHAKGGLIANDKGLAESIRNDTAAVDDVEVN